MMAKGILVIQGRNTGWYSSVFHVLDNLVWCKHNDYLPVVKFGPECVCYYSDGGYNGSNNVWEYYYNPIGNQDVADWVKAGLSVSYTSGELHNGYVIDTDFNKGFCLSIENRKSINEVFSIVKPNRVVTEKINNTFNSIDGDYVAVHIRGTDWSQNDNGRMRSQRFPISFYGDAVADYLDKHDLDNVFVMSDNNEAIEYMINRFGDKVFYRDSIRAPKYSSGSIHHHLYPGNPITGEDVVIETEVASKARAFIHSESNVSLAVLCLNPKLESVYIRTIE